MGFPFRFKGSRVSDARRPGLFRFTVEATPSLVSLWPFCLTVIHEFRLFPGDTARIAIGEAQKEGSI
jgi:hypothetical protein